MILEEKIVIVTGGSGLIGKAIVSDIQQKGGLCVNMDLRVETDLKRGTLKADITDNKSVDSALENLIYTFGRIDGLVNNAYPHTEDWGTPFEDIKLESWRTNVDWQLNSYFYITQQVLKIMRKQSYGSVVNIASIYGMVGNDFTIYEGTSINPVAAYSAIKGGLINLTRFLASQYGQYNIRVNCLSPGGIFNNQPELFVKAYEKKVPMKRMGKPEDIAPAVTFLLSDEAKYITGHNLIVDGGWTAI